MHSDGFLQYGKASVLIDGQFGSTGKGLAAAYIFEVIKDQYDWEKVVCITNAAPNAGHTTITAEGRKFVTFHMPTMGVLSPNSPIFLNAGAIIDIEMLKKEVEDLGVNPNRVFIHQNAAVITPEDAEYEKQRSSSQTKIASTQKGVGRALARKVGRDGRVVRDFASDLVNSGFNISTNDANHYLMRGFAAMVETPQGMGLSLNNGFYPHCTSREVSVSQSLSDAGLHPSTLAHTLATFRTFPIRVGHIYDEDGQIIGNSGPVYPDQIELSWDYFRGVEPERTTVTKRVRRIFSFSEQQYAEALIRLRPTYVHIGFCDYFNDEDEFHRFIDILARVEAQVGVRVHRFYAFGPATTDVIHDNEVYFNKMVLGRFFK